MRVLTITNLFPNPFEPNRATFNRQQLRALAELVPVQVISPIAWTDELAHRGRTSVRLPADRRLTLDGITVDHPRYLFTPKVLRGKYGQFYRWSIRSAFERAVNEFKPDLLFAPWAFPDGWAAVRLGREFGLPTVIKVHGCDVLFGLRNNPSRLPGTKEALRGADGVVAVSRDLRNHVVELGVPAERVRVVYDGIDPARFHPGKRADARARLGLAGPQRRILFVGSLLPVKGLDVLIDACARLKVRGARQFICHLVGEGDLRDQLTKEVTARGLDGIVRLEGPRPHGELPDWFRAADLFVLPSRSEGVPCVLLEAMACGTPFVVSKVGGIPEVAELGRGTVVPPADPEALAEAIDRELSFGGGKGTTGGRVKTHAEAAAELAEFLQTLLDVRPQRRATPPVSVAS